MSKLFRQSALNSMASPEQLNQNIQIVKPRIWLGIISGCLLLGCLIAWGFLGNIHSTVDSRGIIFPKSGVSAQVADHTGKVQDVLYEIGDTVEKGDVIAVIPNEEILAQIEEKKSGAGSDGNSNAELQQLYRQYEKSSIVRASQDGVIQSITDIGRIVDEGQEIASILVNSQYTNNRQVVAYVPLKTAKRLKTGMEVQVCPSYISREEYGYMVGNISSVGEVPVTEDSLERYFGNTQYVEGILPEESCVEVCISMQVDEESSNLFQWSSVKGNELSVEVGTVCDIWIIVQDKKPVSLLF